MSDEIVLTIDPPYIGSAVSPEVDITETDTAYTVDITDFRGVHSYTVEKTDQAIADAEAAAAEARQAASDVQGAVDAATQAAQSATTAAGTANTSAQNADAKAALADSKAALAQGAATTANQAAQAAEAAKTAANTAAGQATTAAGTANTAASNADAKAALADTAAANADTATANANTATTNATNAAQAANNAADVAIEASETITDGYFPKMLAGAAESLMGDTDTATFAERVSEHSDVARIESILGNTVVFNQLASLTNLNPSATNNGVTLTKNADGSVTASGTASGSASPIINYLTVERGHKYLLRGLQGGSASTYYFGISEIRVDLGNGGIWTSNVDASNYTLRMDVTTGVTVDFTFYPQCFDLTRMFGAGNEPATVAEFEAMFPDDYYPYSAGELLSVNIEGVNDREIPVSTYFPDGMKSAGSVHDELTATKAVKRVGVVDLGTLTWIYEPNFIRFRAKVDGIIKTPTWDSGLLCTKYSANTSPITSRSIDKTIARYSDGLIYVVDLDYTDAATFKAAMDGVMLNYELAEPVETEITPPLTLTYTVEQGGTESIVIPTGEQSAAPTLAIVYGLTADGVVDKALSVIAPIEGSIASTNYSVNAYLVHNQQLYRVTSAIATGEAITPGSNCVACTVMGELARLTA